MLLEYQLDWIKIMDFLLIAKFWASPDNYYPPSICVFIPQKIFYITQFDGKNQTGLKAHENSCRTLESLPLTCFATGWHQPIFL